MVFNRRSLFLLPLVLVSLMLQGPRAQGASDFNPAAPPPPEDMGLFFKGLTVVEENFASPLNADKAIYDGALPGMMSALDPHSNFYNPKQFALLREEQVGHYYGVGMEVTERNGRTMVVAPFPGSPAWKAGLRPGDIFVTVNEKSAEGLTTTEVADLLKGPKGTEAKITVSREGASDYLSFTVVRDEINRKSVPDAFWLKPGIAYVKILNFGETTGRELDTTLKQLGEGNIKGLVLDLRGNPGGLLDTGVEVADHFLPRGALIVSHRGRASRERRYFAFNGNRGRDYPMVALVDRMSASAAEIVSGALQDHDRAWILGETTFGKGLVQSVYQLKDNTALALTTAHFYTPSGRLIQRDYSHETFYDYYNRHGEARDPHDVKRTDSGRTVYGGGGITPDQVYTAPPLDHLEAQLFRDGIFAFTRSYFASHRTRLPFPELPDAATLKDLHDYLAQNHYPFSEAEFTGDTDWIERHLAREMYVWAFNKDASDRIFARTDPEVAQAVEALPKAEALLQNAKKAIAQRVAAR
jgi:carboxyl-terminal processing protease